jgi:hypothetical protein
MLSNSDISYNVIFTFVFIYQTVNLHDNLIFNYFPSVVVIYKTPKKLFYFEF